MLVYRRNVRRLSTLVLASSLVAACAGPDDVRPVATAPPDTTLAPTGPDDAEADRDDTPTAPAEPQLPTVSVKVAGNGIDTELEVQVDPDDLTDIDPFGRFATCSGLGEAFGNYSVLVSDVDGPIRSVSVLTFDRVDGAGIHDADVRIERQSGEPVVATGTLTIDAGLRSGTFVAFAPDGESVEGEFRCDGDEFAATPLPPGRDDDVVDTVEVFVLLRNGDAERVLGVAVDASTGTAAIECAGAVGATSDLLVRVDGGWSIGAVTTFELTDGEASAMRLRAGGRSFEFASVDVVGDDVRTSATFSAANADGITVDGAFSCT